MAAIAKSGRDFGRQIFQTVHGEVHCVLGQRFFNFLGKHALGSDLGERHIGDLVASGLDNLDFDLVAALAQ